jgi:hypothetical protein
MPGGTPVKPLRTGITPTGDEGSIQRPSDTQHEAATVFSVNGRVRLI